MTDFQEFKVILQTPQGRKFLEYLADELEELSKLPKTPFGGDPQGVWAVALEAQSQIKAYRKLSEILSPLLDIRENAIISGTSAEFSGLDYKVET